MGKLGSLVRQIIEALHDVSLVQFSWESEATGYYNAFSLLSVGWGTLTFGSFNGRPTLGIQYSYGQVALWCGPLFGRWPKFKEGAITS